MPSATAVLVTAADEPADWLRAGQALHRLLLHAASRWVFASLHSQLLELPALRVQIRTRLALPGAPQMLLQLGRAHTTAATPRRPPAEILD
jgi:DNA-binding GntR family transcriptional regulator